MVLLVRGKMEVSKMRRCIVGVAWLSCCIDLLWFGGVVKAVARCCVLSCLVMVKVR